jgi:alternate signal-mediated exported protein
MKKSYKGAVAAATGGILLLGGAGSLAYWSATQDVPGGTINSGSLALSTPSCAGWTLDTLEEPPTTYVDGDPLVPGDVLTKTCTFAITATGNHLRATLGVTDTSFTPVNDLSADLTADAEFAIAGNAIPAEITDENDGDVVSAAITVTFDPTSGNESQSGSTVLGAITVTADQIHD